MNAAERLVAGRLAVTIRELGLWLGRGHDFVYRAIGRGELQMFGRGRVTADSVLRFYAKHDQGGDAHQLTSRCNSAAPSDKRLTNAGRGGAAGLSDKEETHA